MIFFTIAFNRTSCALMIRSTSRRGTLWIGPTSQIGHLPLVRTTHLLFQADISCATDISSIDSRKARILVIQCRSMDDLLRGFLVIAWGITQVILIVLARRYFTSLTGKALSVFQATTYWGGLSIIPPVWLILMIKPQLCLPKVPKANLIVDLVGAESMRNSYGNFVRIALVGQWILAALLLWVVTFNS